MFEIRLTHCYSLCVIVILYSNQTIVRRESSRVDIHSC